MSKTVKVNIICSRMVHYNQVVTMSKKEFDILDGYSKDYMYEVCYPEEYGLIEHYLDDTNTYDVEEEFTNIKISKHK